MSKETITEEMIDRWDKQLDYCVENSSRLKGWEEEHISSYYKYFSDNGKLTWRQSKVLRQIYNRL